MLGRAKQVAEPQVSRPRHTSQKCSAPAERLHLPRSLDYTDLTDGGRYMSSVIKLAEVLPQTKLQSLR